MTIDQEYFTVEQIIKTLRLNKVFAIMLIFVNFLVILSSVFISVSASLGLELRGDVLKKWAIVEQIFQITLFVLNALSLTYYYKMAIYFLDLLQEDESQNRKFKLWMWFVLTFIIIANIGDSLYVPLNNLLISQKAYTMSLDVIYY